MLAHTTGFPHSCRPDFPADRTIWLIALAILLSRLVLVVFAFRLDLHDAARYIQEAANLLQYGILSGMNTPDAEPLAHDMPGYPLILAGLMLLFKNPWLVARVAGALNAFAFTGAALLVYALLTAAGGSKRKAAGAMLLFALFPESFPYSVIEMPESLFLAFFLSSVLFTVWFLLEPRPGWLCLAFALLGCSVMLKPVSLPFAGVVVLAVVFRYWRQPALRRPVALALIGGLLAEAAVCSPWLIRNYRLFGSASFTTITGSNLFWYNYRYMLLDKGIPAQAVDSILDGELKRVAAETSGWETNPFIQTKALQKLVMSRIFADPLAYAWTVVKRYPNLYGGTGALDLIDMLSRAPRTQGARLDQTYANHPARRPLRIFLSVLLCLMYMLIVVGTVVMIRARLWRPLLLAVIPILYFSLIYGPVTASRYRLTMAPFFAILAAYGIPDRFRSKK